MFEYQSNELQTQTSNDESNRLSSNGNHQIPSKPLQMQQTSKTLKNYNRNVCIVDGLKETDCARHTMMEQQLPMEID